MVNVFLERAIPQVLNHNYVESSFSTITRHLDNGISRTPAPIEDFTNMDQGVEPALIIVCFFFSQTNLDFKFTLVE